MYTCTCSYCTRGIQSLTSVFSSCLQTGSWLQSSSCPSAAGPAAYCPLQHSLPYETYPTESEVIQIYFACSVIITMQGILYIHNAPYVVSDNISVCDIPREKGTSCVNLLNCILKYMTSFPNAVVTFPGLIIMKLVSHKSQGNAL